MTPLESRLRESAKALSTAAFRNGVNPATATQHVLKLLPMADQAFAEARADEENACKLGCTACCHRNIKVTLPEVLAIAIRLFTGRDSSSLQDFIGELEVSPYNNVESRREQFFRQNAPCPLLKDGACTVYDIRPIACRSVVSANRDICDSWLVEPDTAYFIRGSAMDEKLWLAMSNGVFEALAPQGLGRHFDLALTLQIILKSWKRGSGNTDLPSAEVQVPWYRIFPKAPNEPLGHLDLHDKTLDRFEVAATTEGLGPALRILRPGRTSDALMKLQTPRAFEHTDEIAEWRTRFEHAIDEAIDLTSWDATEAFNTLSSLRIFTAIYQGMPMLQPYRKIGDLFEAKIAKTLAPQLLEPLPTRKPGKLRVGFISQNLRSNSGASWALPWVRGLDRSRFEVFVIKLRLDEDPVSFELRDAADHYFVLAGSPMAGVNYVRALDLDYLIYPDLIDDGYNFVFSMFRLARRQAVGWGCPSTTGFPQIDDYISTDLMEPLGAEAEYRENLVRLPGMGVTYHLRPHAVGSRTRADFGLQSEGPLIVLNQHLNKWLPKDDHLLKNITERTGHPLVIFDYGYPTVVKTFRSRLEGLNVPVKWVPMIHKGLFMRFMELADVSLDPPDFSGGHTNYLTLAQKTPIVHRPSSLMRGRQALAQLTLSNVPHLVAKSDEDYVAIATNAELLAATRSQIESEALFDDLKPLRALENYIESVCI